MTDPKVYPITAEFEEFTKDLPLGPNGKAVAKLMATTLGEYEHGTAEPEDVFQAIPGFDLSHMDDDVERRLLCLKLYRAVLEDMVQVMANS